MGKIADKKKEKEQRLLDSAFELFTTKGVQNTSVLDITKKAKMAKGTFYLYFKDKYVIRDYLISLKSESIFEDSLKELQKTKIDDFTQQILFIIDYVIDIFMKNHLLLTFISKNLSWGIFKTALTDPKTEAQINFRAIYENMIQKADHRFKNPEVLLFMLIELVGASTPSIILEEEPISIDEYRPYLHDAVKAIIQSQIVS